MNKLILDNGYGEITLDDLKDSLMAEDMASTPIGGVNPSDLIDNIQETLDKHNLEFKLGKIHVNNKGIKSMPGIQKLPAMEKVHGENAMGIFLFRRILSEIEITSFQNEDFSTKMALIYSQDGVQLGYGANVKVCQNLSILSSDKYFTTFGQNKSHVKHLSDVVNSWAEDAEVTAHDNFEILNNWKNIPVNQKEIFEMIGELTVMRAKHYKGLSSNIYPLGQKGIADVVDTLITNSDNEDTTLYDFYNLVTAQHKPILTSLPTIIPKNISIGNYLKERYN